MKDIIPHLTAAFERERDIDKAANMSKYMRDQFSFFGISQPVRKTISAPFLNMISHDTDIRLPELIHALWELPEREYQYFCIDVVNRSKRSWFPDLINDIEYMITNKSWWDTVDGLSTKTVSNIYSAILNEKIPLSLTGANQTIGG